MSHVISLDKAHPREKGTMEEIEQNLRRRITTQREMGRVIARVKNFFKPVTNFTIQQLEGQSNAPRKVI